MLGELDARDLAAVHLVGPVRQAKGADGAETGGTGWTADGLWHRSHASAGCGIVRNGDFAWYYGDESACTYDTGDLPAGDYIVSLRYITGTGSDNGNWIDAIQLIEDCN